MQNGLQLKQHITVEMFDKLGISETLSANMQTFYAQTFRHFLNNKTFWNVLYYVIYVLYYVYVFIIFVT